MWTVRGGAGKPNGEDDIDDLATDEVKPGLYDWVSAMCTPKGYLYTPNWLEHITPYKSRLLGVSIMEAATGASSTRKSTS
ncbi:hypothetical protein Cob_v011855 [Colletotrichum orbiculare MAFF 240422]|uniref:Uncharacterized protein n=1 Tax=Colletotrichum orbiculare (strain 104-T / ATCC 96160 / CBS 514.97 / LARS 414 / MAFF 240422) TaxID=1213857 RepID=A0A484FAF9_COLOR|nr:hypothetical protein Cob_v011855 [Colletotrichum orbiculare MAFF 240422]